MSCPLYDTFHRQISRIESLTLEQKRSLIDNIKKLDKDGREGLYTLIRYSSKLESDDTVYGAKFKNSKGVVFDLESFPDSLQKVISLFVNKHIEETTQLLPVEIVFE